MYKCSTQKEKQDLEESTMKETIYQSSWVLWSKEI